MTTRAACVYLFCLVFILIVMGCESNSSAKEKQDDSNKSSSNAETNEYREVASQQLPSQRQGFPSFTLYKDSSYEDAGAAKVIWQIVVSTEITKESLAGLLNDLYSQALTKSSFNTTAPQ